MNTLIPKSNRFATSSPIALALAITLLSAGPAAADLRGKIVVEKDVGPATLRVRLQTPDTVRWHQPPVRVRHQAPLRLNVSQVDRRIAYRLSVMTGVHERPLLQKRARNVSWNRIARVHGISQRDLRIAKHPKRFQRWIAAHGPSCGNDGWDDGRRGGHGGKGRGHGR